MISSLSHHSFPASEPSAISSTATNRRPSQLANPTFRRPQFSQPRAISGKNHSSIMETDPNSLRRVTSAHSVETASSADTVNSNFSGFRGNYQLRRVDSRQSMASQFSVETRYHVTLELSSKEISLLRYMWNYMLGEESAADNAPAAANSALPIPGSLWAQAKEKPLPSITKAHHQFGASSTFCSQLYSNLLTMDPTLETSFPSLRHQAVSMAGVLSLAVNSLENLSSLDSYLVTLAKRHSRVLGIEPPQFEMMGEAFIQTFHERFGTRFTHELEVLWIKFYMYLANSLLQFGLDPVMKHTGNFNSNLGHERYGSISSAADSMFTGEESDDIMSAADSMRRPSLATEISSVASAVIHGKPLIASGSTRSGSVFSMRSQRHASATVPSTQAENAQKKKKGGRRAKRECTIM